MTNPPLKRHDSLVHLSRDHFTGLLLASLLKKDTPVFKGMPHLPKEQAELLKMKFETELRQHFNSEEEILFPFVMGKLPEIDRLIVELIEEHKTLRQKILALKESDTLVEELNDIGVILEKHIRKEERQLFQLIQESFSEEDLMLLSKKLRS